MPGSPECRYNDCSPFEQDLNWRQELSEDGQKLYELLLGEAGDTEYLPVHAEELEFDLQVALAELREYGLLDEHDPARVRLIHK